MKTLIVDDDIVSRMILQSSFEQYGQVHFAQNGVEAVESARVALEYGANYDLICLDILMPEMGGLSALASIRELEKKHGIPQGSGAKVVMTTSSSDPDNLISAFEEQCDGYLSKPIDVKKLTDYLRKAKLIV